MAVVCVCGVNDSLKCPNGGFVVKRHNEKRGIEAEFLDELCTSVSKEPFLLPLSDEFIRGTKKAWRELQHSHGVHQEAPTIYSPQNDSRIIERY